MLFMEKMEKMESYKINKFAEKDEDFWKPADLLVAMANNGGKFADAPTDDLKKEKLAFKQEVKY